MMIEKLRSRFFRIAFIAMTVAMLLVAAAINVINWFNVRSELSETLTMLAENQTEPPERGNLPFRERSRHQKNLINESSFFVASWSEERGANLRGQLQDESIDQSEALSMVTEAAQSGNTEGTVGEYRFLKTENSLSEEVYIFLNAETRLTQIRNLALFSLVACAVGILLASIAVSLYSRKAIEPLLKNEREQKQFITDASHELKTPLTVISANMDVLSMDVPNNTWIHSTQKQVAQMRRLVDELVYLSRLEEGGRVLETKPIQIRKLLEEVAEPFAAMAEFQGKKMEVRAEDGLTVSGDEAALQRLFSTLCDNAVKYTPEDGEIIAEARADGKQALIRFSNTVSEPLTEEQCQRLFQRFYRADPSRDKGKRGGFGIGLAIAAAIAEKHGGSVAAEMQSLRLVITCRLPLAS